MLGSWLVAGACSPESRNYSAETGGTAGDEGIGGIKGVSGGKAAGGATSGASTVEGGEPPAGAAGSTTVRLKDQGEACSGDDECSSASCRDGFCCDAVCDGACEACSEARSGAADGSCTAISPDADPDDECDPPSTATCSKDDDCEADEYCAGATCTDRKSGGSSCSKDNECGSTFCRDGVCCESSCGLDCQACSNATSGLANGKCGQRTSSAAKACPASNPTSCVDTKTDLANCGSCGNACPSSSIAGAVRSCTNGTCGLACPAGSLGDGKNVCIPVTTITAGDKFTCGLLSTGKVSCWGDTSGGIAPAGAGVSNFVFSSLSARYNQVCGLRDSGQIVCWGASPSTHSGPYIALATGDYHTCAIKADQTLDCWSSDSDTVIEAEPTGKYKGIASMNHFACALVAGGTQDSKLKCWGDSSNFGGRPPPTDQVFTRVVAGANHGCAIKPDKTIACFGLLYYPDYPATTPFKTLGNGGGTHYCGVLSDDTIFCWGSDGGLGGPAASEPAGTFKTLALGSNHTCGVTLAGRVVCAGDNTYGQSANQPGPFQAW